MTAIDRTNPMADPANDSWRQNLHTLQVPPSVTTDATQNDDGPIDGQIDDSPLADAS